MNFGNQLQYYRKQAGLTQEALASELGVSVGAISKWENKYSEPDIPMLCNLADYFKVTTDELLGRINCLTFAVCDDAAIIREALKTIVEKEGYQCPIMAENGEQFKKALESTVPNAVFLDLTLPDTDGLEFMKQLKQDFPKMKILLLSGDASKETQEKAVSLGADYYITKPFLPEHISATIVTLAHSSSV